jgi:lipoprotein-releasing system permease protein
VRYETFVGLRYLRSKHRNYYISLISIIATIGVSFGVAALVVILSVTSGFQEEFREKVLGTNAHAIVNKFSTDFVEYEEVAEKVRAVDGVVGAAPFTLNEVMLYSASGLAGTMLKGVDPGEVARVLSLDRYLVPGGSIAALKGGRAKGQPMPGILLGVELAEKLKVRVGEVVDVVAPLGASATPGAPPLTRSYRVAGMFRSGLYEFDSHLAYIELRESQYLLGTDTVLGVELKVDRPGEVAEVGARLKQALRRQPYLVKTWEETNRPLFAALGTQRLVLTGLLTAIILVASLNIICTLILMVLEKAREIAILKAMGATDGGVMRIFIIEGMTIGLAGTVLGVILGYLICVGIEAFGIGLDPKIYFIGSLPVQMSPLEFLFVAGAALVISFLATLYPSYRAARVNPVEGLRYE